MIKPNVTSWRSIDLSNVFNISLKMNDEGNRYGFSSDVDTHVMKNSEWAVVSYLSQSKYGKLGNNNFTGTEKKVYKNKSDRYITGCSYGSPNDDGTDYGCKYQYDTNINGTGASTTGNIYGVYDMNGGSWEAVMANYNDTLTGSSFNAMPDSKYYDKYTFPNVSFACNMKECLSHGLSETKKWYNTVFSVVEQSFPWGLRSGPFNYRYSTSIFSFEGGNTSTAAIESSFRLVIA